jgi:hypothetical protein
LSTICLINRYLNKNEISDPKGEREEREEKKEIEEMEEKEVRIFPAGFAINLEEARTLVVRELGHEVSRLGVPLVALHKRPDMLKFFI